jgi:hypothetical protein
MPSRPVSLAIVALWLAALGWLFAREIWPKLHNDGAPPFTFELADEVHTHPIVPWTVTLNGRETYRARNWIEYVEADDAFDLHAEFLPWAFAGSVDKSKPPPFKDLVSHYRYGRRKDRDWELRTFSVQTTMHLGFRGEPPEVNLSLEGTVRDGQLDVHLQASSLAGHHLEWDLSSVPVPSNGRVFDPLNPALKMPSLKAGQSWSVPLIDVNGLSRALGQTGSEPTLNARVLDESPVLRWENKDGPCWIIEYEGKGIRGKTWVRQEDGLVLRQEAITGDNHWTLNRDKPHSPLGTPPSSAFQRSGQVKQPVSHD